MLRSGEILKAAIAKPPSPRNIRLEKSGRPARSAAEFEGLPEQLAMGRSIRRDHFVKRGLTAMTGTELKSVRAPQAQIAGRGPKKTGDRRNLERLPTRVKRSLESPHG